MSKLKNAWFDWEFDLFSYAIGLAVGMVIF
jgi:hypothetical protein